MEPVENVKHRARLLQKRAAQQDPVALATLREQPDQRPLSDHAAWSRLTSRAIDAPLDA